VIVPLKAGVKVGPVTEIVGVAAVTVMLIVLGEAAFDL
jgi:hypothetical protein